ncbi:MAG TPA: hypothetical protein VNQ14_04005, partial [Woeseiaceae bacterium]|nr:hypothetical protein [Woeseiaceae bacterium]
MRYPAADLIASDAANSLGTDLSTANFPARDMHQRGYFRTAPTTWAEAKKRIAGLLPKFLRDAGVREASPAYCRSTAHYRQGKTLNRASLVAWQAQVLIRSRDRSTSRYVPGSVDKVFLQRIADLSVLGEGPRLAREFLEKHGVAVVIEAHLPKTYLDGAAFLRDDGKPVIGLTLR